MTVTLEQPWAPEPGAAARPARSTASRRASLQAAEFQAAVIDHLVHTCAKQPRDASGLDLYHAMSHTVRDRLVHRWLATQQTHFDEDVKRACYFSSEFLTGRSLGLCLMNMGLYEAGARLAQERGFDLGDILECEGDPGLGNGGLGRLAACFLDSMATMQLPAMGYGLRYEYGMFRQTIQDGWQRERPDNWLRRPDPWEVCRPREQVEVKLGCGFEVQGGSLHVIPGKTSSLIGPEQLERFNGFLAAKVLGGGKSGVSSGEAIAAVEQVASAQLPEGYTISWTGMKVLKHDGGQHHGIGIRPTVPVSRTRKGVAEGKDELLLKALEVVKR